jgi:CheY-like chemotaxis protein
MVDQVIMNLAVNARDAMPAGGRLIIETAVVDVQHDDLAATTVPKAGRYVCVRVSDTGEGIPREHLARIFEPFFTTKQPGKGTGLGLATVFGIVEQHRGAVRVYSEVGQGTTFHVLLPAKAGKADALPLRSTGQGAPRGTETVLVVEDEKAIRSLTRTVLEQHGYAVVDADTGANALDRWNEHRGPIDLLLTDMVMPGGMTGRELATALQARDPGLRVLFTSGYSAEMAGQELALEEGHNFLQKPHGTGPLLEAVRRCLDR